MTYTINYEDQIRKVVFKIFDRTSWNILKIFLQSTNRYYSRGSELWVWDKILGMLEVVYNNRSRWTNGSLDAEEGNMSFDQSQKLLSG